MAVMAVDAGAPVAVKERLEAFAGEVLAAAMNRPVQLVNGGLYLRGLLEEGARKSLEPMVERLGGDADYSGTLGKTGNCQIGVSLHAVGARGTVPAGWALYLPEDWCADQRRRHKAKIPERVEFKTKPELGVELVERASGWNVPKAPVLGDHAYGENTWLRDRLDQAGCEYVLSVGPKTKVFDEAVRPSVCEAGLVGELV